MNAATNPGTTPNLERATTRERILQAAGWLVGGVLRHEAVVAAMLEWHVSRRTAQVYVQRAANRLAREAEYDDPLFAMKLSQLQRDRLFQQLQNLQVKSCDMEPQEIRGFLQTVQAQLRVLDSRDRTAARIAQLEAKHGRASTRRDQPAVPPAAAPQESSAEARPAHPELMRPAAQVSRPERRPVQRKHKAHKEMQPPSEAPTPPAPGGENCALESGAVGNKPLASLAAA